MSQCANGSKDIKIIKHKVYMMNCIDNYRTIIYTYPKLETSNHRDLPISNITASW